MRCGLATPNLLSVDDFEFERARFCPRCGAQIVVAGASFCKNCGGEIPGATPQTLARAGGDFDTTIAFVLSIVPGLGHAYRGKIGACIGWFVGVSMSYASAPVFGLIIHMICAVSASTRRPSKRERRRARDSF